MSSARGTLTLKSPVESRWHGLAFWPFAITTATPFFFFVLFPPARIRITVAGTVRRTSRQGG